MITEHSPENHAQHLATIPYSSRRTARHRAVIIVALILGLIVILWLSDAVHTRVPATQYHPQVQRVGAYVVTLSIIPTQPHAGYTLIANLLIRDNTGHPAPSTMLLHYQWSMVAMDMGSESGILAPSAHLGNFSAQLSAVMSGYWRLTIVFPDTAHTTVIYDIPIQP